MKNIPELKLIIEPITDEAKAVIGFKYAPEQVGKRSKIGGKADFIQGDEKLYCSQCKKEMIFYAQIDSVGDEINLVDCGMIYVFVCFDCYETKSILQSN